MNESQSFVSFAPYFDILHRHRVSLVYTLAVGLLLTTLAVVVLPNVYISSTLVTIEPQEVPAQFVSGGVSSHIQDRLKILGEKVLSRTRLGYIIKTLNLYPQRRRNHPITEPLVNYMRSKIDLQVTKEDEHTGSGSFVLSFEDTDPRVAQKAAAMIAAGFIDEDRRDRTRQARATTAFLEDRLAIAQQKLEAKASEIKEFKDQYQGSLPQDLQVNLQTLSSLQGRLQSANEAEVALDERRAQVSREMADARSLTLTSASGGSAPVSPEARLAAMEAELTELRARYSEEYPDVINLEAQIVALKRRLKQGGAGKQDDLTAFDAGFRREGDQIAIEQQRVVTEIDNVKRDIAVYRERIAETPAHQQQFDSLNRDYSVLNGEYHSLLNKRLAAQASQSLEERGEGEHFRVVDPANLPLSPERPDKIAIAIGGTILSLLAAVGVAFGFFFSDTSFKEPEELLRALEVPVAVTIPQLDELGDTPAGRVTRMRAALGSVLAFTMGAGAIWLYASMRQ
jgi:succinoglycan biosynthesis transport protein ExoP